MTTATASSRLSIDPQLVWDLGYELLDLAYGTPHCEVWEVRHRTTYEVLAWKQLRSEFASDPVAQHGLQNEAAVARLVQSPLLPKVLAASLGEGPQYLLLEWFSGETLERAIQAYAPFPVRTALWVARQCAEALEVLLRVNLVHGAVQADNILIRENGTICLSELVQARRAAVPPGMEAQRSNPVSNGPMDDYVQVTTQHQPPQGQAKDLYGLGVILFRMLAGDYPFQQISAAELASGERGSPAVELRHIRPEVPEKLALFVAELLSPLLNPRLLSLNAVIHRLMDFEIQQLALPVSI